MTYLDPWKLCISQFCPFSLQLTIQTFFLANLNSKHKLRIVRYTLTCNC